MTVWTSKTFDQLTHHELYDLLQLRVSVFVVEQCCPYQDLDGRDRDVGVVHMMGVQGGELMAGARLIPKGVVHDCVSIGRVVIKPSCRGAGLGHELIRQSIQTCRSLWPGEIIKISAQSHLQGYYVTHGFQVCSDEYLEDGIAHTDMMLPAGEVV